jgi:hypothetical protein
MSRKRVREITIELLELAGAPKEEIGKLVAALDQNGDLDKGLALVSSAAAVVEKMLDRDAAFRCLHASMRVLIDAEIAELDRVLDQQAQRLS